MIRTTLLAMAGQVQNALTRLVQGLILIYRFGLSPLIGPRCRFYPSCSVYGIEALERHGLVKGLGLTLARLSRCHPWHPGGVDPVPDRSDSPSSCSCSSGRHRRTGLFSFPRH